MRVLPERGSGPMASVANASAKLAIDGGSKSVTNKLGRLAAVRRERHSGRRERFALGQSELLDRQATAWSSRSRFAEWQGSKYAISVATGTAALHVSSCGSGHRARRRSHRAQLHLHRHQFFRRAGRRDSPVRRREPRRPLHQHRVGGEAGDARAPRPSCPCISTATSATWTRSTPSPSSTICS